MSFKIGLRLEQQQCHYEVQNPQREHYINVTYTRITRGLLEATEIILLRYWVQVTLVKILLMLTCLCSFLNQVSKASHMKRYILISTAVLI